MLLAIEQPTLESDQVCAPGLRDIYLFPGFVQVPARYLDAQFCAQVWSEFVPVILCEEVYRCIFVRDLDSTKRVEDAFRANIQPSESLDLHGNWAVHV